MNAISSSLPRLSPQRAANLLDRGKPVASVGYLRPAPTRQPTTKASSVLFAIAQEPEDARLTGGTRSLERRLLALNLVRPQPRTPETLTA